MNGFPYLLSLQVTAVASVAILVVGLTLAVALARNRFPGQLLVETLLNLPLVLPPSVVGFFLLLLLGRGSPLKEWFGIDLLFTWQAGAIASAVVGLPLMLETSRAAIANVNPELEAAARTLGSSELEVLWRITLPQARSGILAGFLMGTIRAFGEFGATLMVAASIPGRTQTLPLAIYDAVQNQDYGTAHVMVLVMTATAFLLLWWVRALERSSHPLIIHSAIKKNHEPAGQYSKTTS
ncbi:MAG: molybdate ABC transporter permease subunit [Oscillatoriophycideae cyanobacterium NC_groundwater_1537_Pr4_S-0.65um_50_18]|nr:molybdate ABC transporter permease subunit [Oscillatoriophycideae cyanobacterium NC_groundwater_1537_Pr4_S-0.65um_50_18]